jgi:hypothetical protein
MMHRIVYSAATASQQRSCNHLSYMHLMNYICQNTDISGGGGAINMYI